MCALIPCHSMPSANRVREIQAPRFGPIQAKFVLVVAGGDMRMAAGIHVGIDADGGGSAAAHGARLLRPAVPARLPTPR